MVRKLFGGLAIFLLCSCNSASTTPTLGTYQGSLQLPIDPNVPNYAVSALLTQPAQNSMHLDITGFPILKSSVDVRYSDDGQKIWLSISQTQIQNIELDSDNACFTATAPISISFCSKASAITIDAQTLSKQEIYNLKLEFFSNVASGITLEQPQKFSLNDAIALTMSKEFNTQIEFQHAMQARFKAKQAYLELMPHLSNGSIFTLATATGPLAVLDVLGMAGDLAPFLFPSRWMEADQATQLSSAENDALALMRGDAALQVESFAYSIDHDTQVLKFLQQDYVEAAGILTKVQALETKALVPPGTADHMASIVASLHDGTDDLREGLQAQYSYLSQAMGFINPAAVSSIEIPDLQDAIENSKTLQMKDLQEMVLSRSMELRQIDTLIASAQTGVSADYFSWMDPQADVDHSLGFGLGQQIKIDQSQVFALQVQREQVASTLMQNLAIAITEYNHARDDYDDSNDGLRLQMSRMTNLKAALDSGQAVSPTEITSVSNDQFVWQIHLLDAKMEYRSSLARIQRLLLEGYYSNLDGSLTIKQK